MSTPAEPPRDPQDDTGTRAVPTPEAPDEAGSSSSAGPPYSQQSSSPPTGGPGEGGPPPQQPQPGAWSAPYPPPPPPPPPPGSGRDDQPTQQVGSGWAGAEGTTASSPGGESTPGSSAGGYPGAYESGYPPGYAYGYYAAPKTDDKAVWALVLAIGGWFLCPIILHVVAWVLANQSLAAIRSSGGALQGEGLAVVARIVAIVGLVVFGLFILVGLVILAIIIAAGTAGNGVNV